MEATIAVNETHQSCSSNLVAKSVESPLKIDSISIDLNNANDDIDTGKCEHFSIRGYTSEMRNKDWKKCWPFSLDGGQNISEESEKQNCKLPPLLVPKFRWWCCQNCLQEIGAEGSINEEINVANNSSKLKSFGSCPNVSSHGDAVKWLSDLQQAGKINIESRKHDANACVNVDSSDCLTLFSDKSEKKGEIEDIPIIGQTDVLEDNINKETHISNYAGIEVISSLMQQSLHIDDKVASLHLHKPDLKDNEIAGVKLPESNSKCIVKDVAETRQTGKQASACDQQMELAKACGSYGITSLVPDAIKTHTEERPSFELDDCGYASSESAVILLGIASGSLHRRKTRKVRLLTELLGKNGVEKTDHTSTEDSPSTAIPDASIGIDSMSAPQGNVPSSLAHGRKRKLPQDEEWRPEEISSPNNGHKNLRTFNKGTETADGIETFDSEGTVNRSSSQAPAKSHFVNFKVDKSPILGKKKNKKTQNFDGCLFLSVSPENLQKERQKKPADTTKSNATDIILYKSNDDFSDTSNNGKTVELQNLSAVVRKHYDQRAEMVSEQGALDDIPMEIVELMAKNQYERCLPDTEIDKQLSETTNNTRNQQRVDLNKVYGNEEMSLFNSITDKPKPRAKNGRIGKIVRGDNVGSGRQKSVVYFSHMDRNQNNMSQLEQSYSPAGFRPFPLCGEKLLNGVQFSATNSSRQNSAQNCQWIGNMVGQRSSHASVQALGVCNTCQSAPQQNKEAAHLWPSTIPNNMPYLYSIPQKCVDQVAKVDVLSHCPGSLPKRNTSGNDDRNFLNLASNFEKHGRKFDSEVLIRTHADYPFACKHNGSSDLYSNETIPAMHLLSLMDAGLQSGAPVDVDGNQRFVKKTPFLHGLHSKEFSSLPSGGYRTNSMKHPSYDCYGKNHLPESFCECKSPAPAVTPTSFQHDKSFKKATDFRGQFSQKSREKEKKRCSDSQRQNRNHGLQKTISSSSCLNTTCGSIPAHSMPKLVPGTSAFMKFTIQTESATKQKQKAHTMRGTLFHPKSGSENEICCINRNPADFTVPEAGNIYMTGGEDLKFGREATSSGLIKLVGHKRQRKLTVRKEHSRN
ncbi:hypothetical protein CRYUN_Cryun03dG0038700 [Craigia yunnanensis]